MQVLQFNIKYFFFLFWGLFALLQQTLAQDLKVISRYGDYKDSVQNDSLQKMVEIKHFVPSVAYDLRYATKENFTGEKLYKSGGKTFLRLPAAEALCKAAREFAGIGYTIKIWDAYRPYSVTKKMWELIYDDRYVADPSKGSGHNRGLAVDLTLMKDGKELDMGTGFDNFTDTAHRDFSKLPESVLKNRLFLQTTMEKYGFKGLSTEWWHFAFPNDGRYGVLNIDFKKLAH
ncbi:M15 family metallopeptidase [Flavisolibacter ginsenosidimutans]|uniref:D-alanyl-D-alanine dipeptidase n=1 Tax=Flavisolibacter ginsenosidimutans TaxID=661481 RepID=A0A5B8UNL1_9BACT|nr:M15 family metallopeptidase [Flavisolibacter ginsenosidimutans]QEC58234.1 M15 family metallopeptidase [Flavisolibacter ginsenosidimutans]